MAKWIIPLNQANLPIRLTLKTKNKAMWIWIIIIAVIIGAIIGFAQNGEKEDAMGGAMAGGCLAASCLGRLAIAAISIIVILWLFGLIFG